MHSDSSGLEQLCRDHTPALFPFVLNLTRNEADAEDVLQDLFLSLARHPARMEGIRSAEAFLFRLAHNLAVDLIRARESRGRAHDAASLEIPRLFLPVGTVDDEAEAEVLVRALGTLSTDQRAVVHLKIWGGMTFGRIGNILGIPPNTAASRYRYALERLRPLLRPLQDELRQTSGPLIP